MFDAENENEQTHKQTYDFKSYPKDLVMGINALPNGTSASTWFRTRDLPVKRPLRYTNEPWVCIYKRFIVSVGVSMLIHMRKSIKILTDTFEHM